VAGAPEVAAALRSYEASRRGRTAFITRASRRFGAVAQWENPLLCWLRDTITRSGVARGTALKQFEEMLSADPGRIAQS
jgi:2-polyprenyl-6-methoxyphenol hydroxylase-like FAD-dependent oxidoreductase